MGQKNSVSVCPRVVIAGRPNVGKSTLFNRLIGKRKAITHHVAGVTRDAVEERFSLKDKLPVTLVDTGGIMAEPGGVFDPLVKEKAIKEAEKADVILLLLDVVDFTAEDEELINLFRPFEDRVILVVNKVDSPQREDIAWNFMSLGFSSVCFVSAEHRLGIEELEDRICKLLPDSTVDTAAEEEPDIKISILGKPNTGKSTLLNTLLGEYRAIVSDVPGTTRDLLEGEFSYKGKRFFVVDTAGIRRKSKVHDDIEFFSVRRSLDTVAKSEVVILMVDAKEGLSEQDKKIAAVARKHGRGMVLAVNKWDLMEDIPNQFNAVKDRIRFLFPHISYVPIVKLSAKEGEGINNLLNKVIAVREQLHRKLDTGPLNRKLREWVERTPPPGKKALRYKVRYITQTSTMPVKFVLFVNRVKGFPSSYVSYIENNIRKEFGLLSIPIDIELRQ
ncbi:ribosome biogenesis GTPase Der [Spirochaetia bacterium 38H-sp]|uniref:GTPase Der n=1 Tax=Rarispira pelagica TaxID=3141764 RepID=A0ABU9UBA6_9SPIR